MVQKNPWEMTPAELAAAARSTRPVIGGPVPGGMTIVTGPADPAYATKGAMAAAQLLREQAAAKQAAAQQAADTRIKNAQADEQERKNRQAAEEEKMGPIDPATRQLYAQQVLAGAPLPSLGMGKVAAASRQAIMQEVAKQAGAQGLTGADLARQIVHYKAGTAEITNLEKMAGTIGVNEQTALSNGQQYLDRSAELPGQTGSSIVNAISNWIQRRFGGTTISGADAAYNTFATEYGKVVAGSPSGAGTLTDSARHEAMATINGNGSLQQKQAAFDQMKADMANRMVAIHGGINEAYKALTSRPGYDVPATTDGLMLPEQNGQQRPGVVIGGIPGATGGPNGTGGSGGPGLPVIGGGGSGGAKTLSTGDYHDELDPVGSAKLEKMMRGGASFDDVNAAFPNTSRTEYDNVRAALARDPNLTGFARVTKNVPNTKWQNIQNQPLAQDVGTTALAFGDGMTGGLSDEIGGTLAGLATGHSISDSIADLNRDKEAAFATHPYLAAAGEMGGMFASSALAGSRLAALAGRYMRPGIANVASDVALGALAGAGQDNDDRVGGALIGATGALAGNGVGWGAAKGIGAAARTAPGQMIINGIGNSPIGRFAGAALPTAVAALSTAEQAVANAAGKAGTDSILSKLAEAGQLNVPMSLADTAPELRELAGAAVRRSPSASSFAEDNLIPRNRGQFDRFTATVDQNLGPTANIPQVSANLLDQARTAAGPLYDKAYAAPVVSTPELEATLNTPFGRQALARAKTIAANERRDPTELGFATDSDGNVVLNPRPNQAIADHLFARDELDAAQNAYRAASSNPGADLAGVRNRVLAARQGLRDAELKLSLAPDPSQPLSAPGYTTQTLDYVKRGMDDVLEDQRNPLTGKLVLDEAGRAQNAVRSQFLAEVDKINPAYADARVAYAGPASARSNMGAGVQAYTANPQQLAVDVAGSSPDRLGQMQLGYQGALVDHASRVRDTVNPWEVTLGSPAARDRLGAMFPDGSAPGGVPGGIDNILRTRDLEGDMQSTSNAILGNSRTARNQIADQDFAPSPIIGGIIDAGTALATHGMSLPLTALRYGSQYAKDAVKLGILPSRAVAKADDIAPILITPDAVTSSDALNSILAQMRARQGYVDATTPTRTLTSIGSVIGSQAPIAALTYGGG